ncbi:hypothetical protein BU25DRAFT_453326 [Macroventuria anomochaeta]|uniref:Uncharacterized protein n=1 Tax=Macroventuria anomochaeta TaxID=301207 RepID=A0ACB6SHE2_9PLEO|nr:uncharacterized protein BU25DRAFT_453326 [Macroventuria anomochaeta]KAF2633581.1 hypothetical protein BU25DRAFT_453326 [Macroventuria anomochaeta]
MLAANRFSILAGLNPSPETKWGFDFVPTSRSGTKRRGKRVGKQQRLKHAPKKTCEKPKGDGLDELCKQYAALRLGDNAPTAASQVSHHELRSSTPTRGSTPDVTAVRHHWAPQFRPNSLPTPRGTLTEPTIVHSTTLLQEPQRTLLSPKSVQDPSTDVSLSSRKPYSRFPLSAFLKDLTSPADCVGYWPPKTPAPEPSPPPQANKVTKSPTAAPPATPAQSATAAAACSALVLSRDTASPSSNAIRTRQAAPATSSLSTNTVPTYKRFPAFGVPPFTPSPGSVPASSPILALPPAPATRPTTPTSPQPKSSSAVSPTALPTNCRPAAASNAAPPLPVLQKSSITRPSRPPAPQKSPWGWQEVSEGITIFNTSPSALITAPVTSPYPFVYPPRPWTPTAVPKDLFKDTAAVPSMLRRKFAFSPPSPEVQKELEDFLDMGHADDCWCSSSKHRQSNSKAPSMGTAVGEPHLHAPQTDSKDLKGSLHVTGSEVAAESSQTLQGLSDLYVDVEDDSSDSDAVLATPSSEGSSSGFEDFFGVHEVLHPFASDDDEWVAVSPRLQARRPSSLPSSRTASAVSVQTSNSTSVVAPPTTSLPSPPETPPLSICHAWASDAESETD